MKKIIILSNDHAYTYNLRREIIEKLIKEGHKVYLVLPYGPKIELLKEMGCEHIDLNLDKRGMNPFKDSWLLYNYYKIINRIKPDVVLSYTVKPNLYGGMVCRHKNIPFFPNITGLGTAVEDKSMVQKILISLYKIAFKKAACIFFQNKENKDFFLDNGINNKYRLIPGSGVNTEYFSLESYPLDKKINFMYIARIMKEKGIDQYLDAAKYIKRKYPFTCFHVLGFCEDAYKEKLKLFENEGFIKYHGMQSDVREFHKISHCTIHPTYYPEGMSNVLLESAASGRPIITTDRSGCREIIDDNINGFVINQRDSQDLIDKIEKFIQMSNDERKEMGLEGRKKMKKEFERKIIVDAYMDEINKIQ